MRIFVVSPHYYPDTFRVTALSAALVRRGHQVRILTGLPDYTTSRVPEAYRYFKNRRQWIDGVEVVRIPVIARRSGAFFRCMNYLSFALTAAIYCLFMRWQFDVIYVYGISPVTVIFPAAVLKKISHKKLFYYCMDIWPECVKVYGIGEGSLFYSIISWLSRGLYRQCDHIAVTSKPFIDYLHCVNDVPFEKMEYLPQEAGDDYLSQDLTTEPDGITNFMFMGNIGKAQDVACIIEAADRLKGTPGFRIHLVGDGSDAERCRVLVREKALENQILFYGRRPHEEMEDYYRLADACLLTLNGDTAVGLTLPAKLQGYMAAGKPVIAAADGAVREVITESGCGLCTGAGDAEGLAELLLRFMENTTQYSSCGERGRAYFKKHFTEERHLNQLEKQLGELIQ